MGRDNDDKGMIASCCLAELPHSQSTPVMSTSACTKVLYFTDRSLTPFMVSIPKR